MAAGQRQNIIGVFTDIDDTLTTHQAITADALQALQRPEGGRVWR
jgi:hydroxymethylpyrimidine pyrophosphatase-like HAD family hydrolase